METSQGATAQEAAGHAGGEHSHCLDVKDK